MTNHQAIDPSPQFLTIRNRDSYSGRNTSNGALLTETAQIFSSLAGGMSIEQARQAVFEGSLVSQSSITGRRRIWNSIHYRYLTHRIEWIIASLRDGLDAVAIPVQAAALPDRAAKAVRQLGQRITDELEKKTAAEAAKAGRPLETKPVRQTRPVRVGDVATVTRVGSEAEWEALRDNLDKRVRELLAEGFEVEIL